MIFPSSTTRATDVAALWQRSGSRRRLWPGDWAVTWSSLTWIRNKPGRPRLRKAWPCGPGPIADSEAAWRHRSLAAAAAAATAWVPPVPGTARQSRSRSESRWPAGARARAAATRGCQSLCPAPLASLAGSVPRDCRELEAWGRRRPRPSGGALPGPAGPGWIASPAGRARLPVSGSSPRRPGGPGHWSPALRQAQPQALSGH